MPNEGLFDLPGSLFVPAENTDSPVSQRQVEQLRSAFEAAAIISMDERQRIIQDSIGRPVANIRQLLSGEVLQVLSSIDKRGRRIKISKATAWDDREEDTWIDRL